MSNLQARLASAFLLSVAASAGSIANHGVARAADNCIAEPKPESPQGKHWYYRIERSTGRHCWYLRGENETSARTPAAQPLASARPAPAAPDNAPARSLADAHAEFAAKAAVEEKSSAPASPSVWPDPQPAASPAAAPAATTTGVFPAAPAPATSADAQSNSPWPQQSAVPSANTPPDGSQPAGDAPPAEAARAPAQSWQVSPPPAREVGSLQKLALVAFGALALAGITGSLVYRLAGARWRRSRLARWPQRQPAPSLADEARGAPWVAPELSPTVSHVDVMHEDAVHEDAAPERIEFGRNDDSFEKIEDFLARLTQQLQDETTRSTELEKPHPH